MKIMVKKERKKERKKQRKSPAGKVIMVVSILALLMLSGCSGQAKKESDTEATKSTQQKGQTNVSGTNKILKNISVGWNLGNAFDSCVDGSKRNVDGSYLPSFYETAWGNPTTTQEMIDMVADAGFQAIRLPVTWYYNTYEEDGHIKIQEDWLYRIKDVIDYAYQRNLYVVLDSHHDGELIYADKSEKKLVSQRVEELWTQIAEFYKEYDEHLIFGGLNELNDKDNSWQVKEEYLTMNNQLNQVYVDAVRATGGNNTDRLLICQTYLSSFSDDIIQGFVLPQDEKGGNLAVEVHCYSNYYNQNLEKDFTRLDQLAKKADVPLVIGEFGVPASFQPENLKKDYAMNFVYRAKQHNMVCFWWDDGKNYALFDRENLQCINQDVVDGLMNPNPVSTQYTSQNAYGDSKEYRYLGLNKDTGLEEESDWGSVILTTETGDGVRIEGETGYDISLTAIANADGVRLKGAYFYDGDKKFLERVSLEDKMDASIEVPQNAKYMKITMCNIYAKRAEGAYKHYVNTGELYVEVSGISQ